MPEPLGRACIFPGVGQKAVTVVDVCILKLDPNFDSKWLMFALNNPIFRNVIYSKATGTTRVRISKKNLQSIEILLPPLSEQKRIAEILTSVDDAIQATEKVISQTKRVKQGLLQELFTRGIGHSKFKKTESYPKRDGCKIC
jgi:type I restriction enzyme S subunit